MYECACIYIYTYIICMCVYVCLKPGVDGFHRSNGKKYGVYIGPILVCKCVNFYVTYVDPKLMLVSRRSNERQYVCGV
jgi:hypothetical protein